MRFACPGLGLILPLALQLFALHVSLDFRCCLLRFAQKLFLGNIAEPISDVLENCTVLSELFDHDPPLATRLTTVLKC